MRTIVAAILVTTATGCSSGLAQHMDALDAHLDALSVRLDRIASSAPAAATAPTSQHAFCKAHDGKPEVDLGVPAPCPGKPDDGVCLKLPGADWVPQSVAEARCAAGKL